MKNIRHKFLDHHIHPGTKTLIIGTFNPDTSGNPADFFYSRSRNFLWKLLPVAFNREDLKGKTRDEKIAFVNEMKVDFTDLITEVKIESGSETNYADAYLDSRVSMWRDVLSEMKKLNSLKKVCLTRKSFANIPNMKVKMEEVKSYCVENNIDFEYLLTPARYYNIKKQQIWTNYITK